MISVSAMSENPMRGPVSTMGRCPAVSSRTGERREIDDTKPHLIKAWMSFPFPVPITRQSASVFSARPPVRDGIEPLEARIAPASFVVNSLLDGAPAADGKLTLRE